MHQGTKRIATILLIPLTTTEPTVPTFWILWWLEGKKFLRPYMTPLYHDPEVARVEFEHWFDHGDDPLLYNWRQKGGTLS